MGLVPKKTKAEQRVFRHLNLTKIVGFIITLALASQISDMFVNPKLNIVFILFCCVEFFILSGKSPSDPCKCFALAWLDWLMYLFSPKTLSGKEVENNEDVIEIRQNNDEK